jgi:hypothetical protein
MWKFLAACVIAAGCGGGGGGDDGGDDGGPDAAFDPTPQLDDAPARIQVSAQTSPTTGNTFVMGRLITDPPLWPYDIDAPVGSCRYSAIGAEVAAFSAMTTMPVQLELVPDPDRRLVAGQTLTLAWVPADPGSRVRITLGADNGHAMLRSALIECDLPDEAGSVVIPEAMITRFVDPANWSCGECLDHELKRYRRARATAGATEVDLWLAAVRSLFLVPER